MSITKEEVIEKAIELYKEWGQVPIYELIRSFNKIDVVYDEGLKDSKISGTIIYSENDDKFSIVINPNDVSRRQRFTAGHELGHYVLHYPIIKERLQMNRSTLKYNLKQEKEADKFAGEVLMPEKCIKDYIEKRYGKSIKPKAILSEHGYDFIKKLIEDVADAFIVSEVAVAIRLRELDYYIPYME